MSVSMGAPWLGVSDESDPDDNAVKKVLKSSSRREEEPTASYRGSFTNGRLTYHTKEMSEVRRVK